MAQVAATAGVYPTTNRVGGDDYGVHTEGNLAYLTAGLAGSNFVLAGLSVTVDGVLGAADSVIVAPGVAIVGGYYVTVTQPTTVACDISPGSRNDYIYLRLVRDGLGNVASIVAENNTADILLDAVVLAVANISMVAIQGLTNLQPLGLSAHRLDGYHANVNAIPNTVPVRNDTGELTGNIASATVAASVSAAHLQYLLPSDTVLWAFPDINDTEFVVVVPRFGRIRAKVTVNQTVADGYLDSEAIYGTGDIVVTRDCTLPSLSFNVTAGTDLIIKSVQLCGTVNASPEPIVL